jgi:hypothetical protein
MTQPVYPFQLVHPPSYTTNGAPTHTELNLLQDQVAVAADGRIWTDVAALRSWRYALPSEPSAVDTKCHIYEPVRRRWFTFGTLGGQAAHRWTISGAIWMPTINVGESPTWSSVGGVAVSNAGVLLVGGTPSSGTTAKLRESTDGGTTFTSRSIGASNTEGITELAYSEALGLWFASVGGNAGQGLFSSPDRITWTLRTGAGGPPRHITIRETPSPIIIGTDSQSAGATTGYFRSVDGITWTTETFPVTLAGSNRPAWSDVHGKFFVPAAAGIYSSSTGLTSSWTLGDATFTGTGGIAAFGRTLIRGDGKISIDGGITWFAVLELATVDLVPRAYPGVGVLMKKASTRELYLSQLVGF